MIDSTLSYAAQLDARAAALATTCVLAGDDSDIATSALDDSHGERDAHSKLDRRTIAYGVCVMLWDMRSPLPGPICSHLP
jgi:hypothetical protein